MINTRTSMRIKRKRRIAACVRGTAARPRLSVYRSGTVLFVQIINDDKGLTIVSKQSEGKNVEAAKNLGREIAAIAVKHNIISVVFDRGGNRYHGAVKALAEAAREGGLKF